MATTIAAMVAVANEIVSRDEAAIDPGKVVNVNALGNILFFNVQHRPSTAITVSGSIDESHVVASYDSSSIATASLAPPHTSADSS